MRLDISRLFGGYTRTFRLRAEQRKASNEGNRAALREFRTFNRNPLWFSCFGWAKRDSVLPEHVQSAAEGFQRLGEDLSKYRSDNVNHFFNTNDYEMHGLFNAANEFAEARLEQFRKEFFAETGIHPEDLPPFILRPLVEEAHNTAVPTLYTHVKLLETKGEVRTLYNIMREKPFAPYHASVNRTREHLAMSSDPVDLFNAQLLYGSRGNLPAPFKDKLDKLCPIIPTLGNVSKEIHPQSRLDPSIWVVDVNDIDPLYKDSVNDLNTGSCRYAVVCTETLSHPKNKHKGILFLPEDVDVHLTSPKNRYSLFSNGVVHQSSGYSIRYGNNGFYYFNNYPERNLNFKVEDSISRCQKALNPKGGEPDYYNAQQYYAYAVRNLQKFQGSDFKIYDPEVGEKIESLNESVSSEAETARNTLIATSPENPLVVPLEERVQVAPYMWIKGYPGNWQTTRVTINAECTKENPRSGNGYNLAILEDGILYDAYELKAYRIAPEDPDYEGQTIVIKASKDKKNLEIFKFDVPAKVIIGFLAHMREDSPQDEECLEHSTMNVDITETRDFRLD